MTDTSVRVERFLSAVTQWADHHPEITGVALVGSHARNEARPDSDVDLILLIQNPERLVEEPTWAASFGEIACAQVEPWGRVTSLRVHYRNGLEVEFGISTPEWAGVPIDEGTRRVVSDGMVILLDRSHALHNLLDLVSAS